MRSIDFPSACWLAAALGLVALVGCDHVIGSYEIADPAAPPNASGLDDAGADGGGPGEDSGGPARSEQDAPSSSGSDGGSDGGPWPDAGRTADSQSDAPSSPDVSIDVSVAADAADELGSPADAGAAAFVQLASATPATMVSTVAATFPDAQNAGDLIVVAIAWADSASDVFQVSDAVGNSYRLAVGPTRGSGLSQSIYYAADIAGADTAANAVEVAFTAGESRISVVAVEYGTPATILDVAGGASGQGMVARSATVSTNGAPETLFAAATTTGSFSGGDPLCALRVLTGNGSLVEDLTAGSVGSYSAQATLLASADWVMQVATFR